VVLNHWFTDESALAKTHKPAISINQLKRPEERSRSSGRFCVREYSS